MSEKKQVGERPLFDQEETADYLKTTPRHVRKLIETRELASIKVGNLVRVHPDDVDAYIARHRREAVPA